MKYKIKETGVELRELHDDYYEGFGFISKQAFDSLGLTLEPIEDEPKKLCAWRSGVAILFTTVEDAKVSGMRAPEFDLTFPKETK